VSRRNVTIDFAAGLAPPQEQIDELAELIDHLLKLPAFTGKRPCVVLNALVSPYWTAAELAGMQAQAAEGMVQIGGRYLAGLALAQRAATATGGGKPTVH
jgi:hypothetical protein